MLPCQHTFCLACLSRLLRGSEITCPIDRKLHLLSSSGVGGLPKNFVVQDIVDAVDSNVAQENSNVRSQNDPIQQQPAEPNHMQEIAELRRQNELIQQQLRDSAENARRLQTENSNLRVQNERIHQSYVAHVQDGQEDDFGDEYPDFDEQDEDEHDLFPEHDLDEGDDINAELDLAEQDDPNAEHDFDEPEQDDVEHDFEHDVDHDDVEHDLANVGQEQDAEDDLGEVEADVEHGIGAEHDADPDADAHELGAAEVEDPDPEDHFVDEEHDPGEEEDFLYGDEHNLEEQEAEEFDPEDQFYYR